MTGFGDSERKREAMRALRRGQASNRCRESEISRPVVQRQDADHWGARGSLEAPPSGAGAATTVLHGSVPVEREDSKPGERDRGAAASLFVDGCRESEVSLRVMDRRYGPLAQSGSMPRTRQWQGGCNGGSAALPLAKMVRVLPAHILR